MKNANTASDARQILFVPTWAGEIVQQKCLASSKQVINSRKASGLAFSEPARISLEEAATVLKRMAVPFLLRYADLPPGSMPSKVGLFQDGRYVAIAPGAEAPVSATAQKRLTLAKQVTANRIFEQDMQQFERFHGRKPR